MVERAHRHRSRGSAPDAASTSRLGAARPPTAGCSVAGSASRYPLLAASDRTPAERPRRGSFAAGVDRRQARPWPAGGAWTQARGPPRAPRASVAAGDSPSDRDPTNPRRFALCPTGTSRNRGKCGPGPYLAQGGRVVRWNFSMILLMCPWGTSSRPRGRHPRALTLALECRNLHGRR